MNRGSQLAESANKFLEDKKVELAEAQAAYEVAIKKKKKGQEPPPAPNPDDYKQLPMDILKKMLKERLSQEDCNAGAIFDNLESEYWKDSKTAIELICEAVPQ